MISLSLNNLLQFEQKQIKLQLINVLLVVYLLVQQSEFYVADKLLYRPQLLLTLTICALNGSGCLLGPRASRLRWLLILFVWSVTKGVILVRDQVASEVTRRLCPGIHF